MGRLSAVLFCALCLCLASSSAVRVVCYFTNWTIYRPDSGKFQASNVDPNLCTHIMYAFVGLAEDGNLQVLDDWEATGLHEVANLIALKQQNPALKVLLSMGGWNEGSTKYSNVAADAAKRATMIQSVLSYIDQFGFDGFDLDWEYPGQREGNEAIDETDYVTWLGEMKTALNAKGLILSAAVSGGVASMDISYPNIPALSDNLDLINIMAYDFHGSFEPYVGHCSPLYASSLDSTDVEKTLNVDAGLSHWIDQGVDISKVNLGLALYGRTFTLQDAANTALYAPINGGGTAGPWSRQEGILNYNEICYLDANYEYVFDDEQQVPHKISGNQWIGYEDANSIKIKVNYALNRNVGGFMVWSLDTDDFMNLCGEGSYPLLSAINQGVKAFKKETTP